MQYGIFNRSVVTIWDKPETTETSEWGELSTIGDEGLYGQVCRCVTAPGGIQADGQRLPEGVAEILTFYGYHGYVMADELVWVNQAQLEEYWALPGRLAGRAMDILSLPKVSAVRLGEVEKGGVVRLRECAAPPQGLSADGWAGVLLPDGREGWVRNTALDEMRYSERAVLTQQPGHTFDEALAAAEGCAPEQLVQNAVRRWFGGSEEDFRAVVCRAAEEYLGTEYRWGGKSGRGIDCSGLVSCAYMQCGVLIYRNARIEKGWPMHEIPYEAKKPGDALYFPGHIALYLGDGWYIHSTGAAASGGVVYNSLDPASELYREDLAKSLYAVGSVF